MKYLKNFETDPQYQEYIEGENAILPNVSCVKDDNQVYYNPKLNPLEAAYVALEKAGYTPITEMYLGYFMNGACYPQAEGRNEAQEHLNCYFTVNGKVATLIVDDNSIAQDATISEYDEQTFQQELFVKPEQMIFIQTTLQDLRNVYIGNQIID